MNPDVKILASKETYTYEDLLNIMHIVRSEGGCPWDREQDHQSIRKNLIEETYEVVEAIDNNDPYLLREELGDLLLQIVFHAQIEKEAGSFTMEDVANDICAKLVHRHPHIFGKVEVSGTDEVLSNWEAIKSEEKKRLTTYDRLNAVPRHLPALMRAEKLVAKAKKESCTFLDCETKEDTVKALHEDIAKLLASAGDATADKTTAGDNAPDLNTPNDTTADDSNSNGTRNDDNTTDDSKPDDTTRKALIGSILFKTVRLAKEMGVEAEEVLEQENQNFIQKFKKNLDI